MAMLPIDQNRIIWTKTMKGTSSMTTYAYIRVSTKEQKIDRQIMAIEGYRIHKKNVYCDWQSGKDFNRPSYQKLIRQLKPGDLIVIKSIDRLGRNYNEILHQWQLITKEIGADIVVMDMPLLDTRQKADNLTGTLISDLVLQIFAYVAQTEREYIHQRQAEGIAAAKAKGKKLGRPALSRPVNFQAVCERYYRGDISSRKAAKELGLSHTTFYRMAKINHERMCVK